MWPLCSPDLTPADFLFWGRIRDAVYMPSLPVCRDLLGGYELLWLPLCHQCLQMCGLHWNTDMCHATLTEPLKTLQCRRQKLDYITY